MTKIINLYGGPGTGKSTTAAHIFALMKLKHINCEMSLEYVKGKVWEQSYKVMDDQIYVFGKQVHQIKTMMGKVDYIVTDAPLLLSHVYGKKEPASFTDLINDKYKEYDNLNYFLIRNKPYSPVGRRQSEESAKNIDHQIEKMLVFNGVKFKYVHTDESAAQLIVDDVLKG